MITIQLVIYIILAIISVGGGIVAFFVMQNRQNMKIERLEEEVKDLKRKQSDSSHYQIETEKAIVEINTKLDYIMEAINELKARK